MSLTKIREIIEQTDTHRKFFDMIGLICPPGSADSLLVERAYYEMRRTCREQKRDDGSLYYAHPRAVTAIMVKYLGVRDPEKIASGLTHDMPEDFPEEWTHQKMGIVFSPRVAEIVWWVTKPPAKLFGGNKFKRNHEYHSKLFDAPRDSIEVKAPDRHHNTLTLYNTKGSKQRRKVQETYDFYLPLFQRHNLLFHETEEALDEVVKEWK